ncbi:MAG: TRAP transporter large permease [Burkholderiales bacterium]
MVWLMVAAGLLVMAVTGVPVGIALGLTGLAILHFLAGGGEVLAITAVWNVLTDFVLSAGLLFIFMGECLLFSGLSRRLYNAVTPIFQRLPGGLLHTNIAVCTMFGAVCGASTATAAAVGSVAYPELSRRGYDRPEVLASLAAGGTLGLLIPPSLSLLIYGATQSVSIGDLFIAGIIPGLFYSLMFMMLIYFRARRNAALCPVEQTRPPWGRVAGDLLRLWPFALLVFSVLGTIYLGIATTTEAASLGVFAAIAIGFLWGDLRVADLVRAFRSGTAVMGSIAPVFIGALILAQAISILGVPTQIVGIITDLQVSKYAVFGIVVLIYLVLGCFFDGISMMLMTLPVVFPVMTRLGFDPVWLGVMITILVEIGMLTPPVGMNLYVLVAISRGEVTLAEAARAAIPYWGVLLAGLVVMTMVPSIILFLPRMFH